MKLTSRSWLLVALSLGLILLGYLLTVPKPEPANLHTEPSIDSEKVSEFNLAKINAENGDSESQMILATYYAFGRGVARDLNESAKWWFKAAEQGEAVAQMHMADLFASGENHFSKDSVAAASWYRKAAEQGVLSAQYSLGKCYANGEGVLKDEIEAIKWCRMAAEHGHAQAQSYLGNCYAHGIGVGRDITEAYAYLNLAGVTNEEDRAYRDRLEKEMSPEWRLFGQKRSRELQIKIETNVAEMNARIAAKKAKTSKGASK
jgi:TPR repeat protein